MVYSEIEIEHRKKRTGEGHSRRNLDIYRKMKAEQAPFTPRDLFYYGRELYYFAAQDPQCLQEARVAYAGVFLMNELPDSDAISSVFWERDVLHFGHQLMILDPL